jgi:outer membrane lipoprotein-sorting protein
MKRFLMLFLVMGTFVFGNSLSKINTLEAKVTEKTYINKNSKEKVYKFQMKYPDKVYKEMLSPKINLGETYTYNGNKKRVYYPMLKESFFETITEDENYILQAIKAIKQGNKNYTLEKKEIKEFDLGEGIKIVFLSYKKFDGVNFPTKVEVYENKRMISELLFSDVKINKNMADSIFNIK